MQINAFNKLSFSAYKYPLIQKKEEKALYSKFQTDNIFLSSETNNKKSRINLSKAIGFTALFLGTGLICFSKIKKCRAVSKENSALQDLLYHQKIAQAIGLKKDEADKLSSIVGPNEFQELVKKMSQAPEVYSPGTPVYAKDCSIEKYLNENVLNYTFGANLHMHSNNSDGKMSILEILSQAVKYANERAKKGNPPFVLAISDHDGVQGCREAVEQIVKEPEKYKNLKVVLGCENTFVYSNPELLKNDIRVHMLSYAINPYDESLNSFLLNRIKSHNEDMEAVLKKANEKFSSALDCVKVNFSLNDMQKITPSIAVSLRDTTYYMKDYLQFKMIFERAMSNKRLQQKLTNENISLEGIDFSKPIELIPKNPDYSNGKKYYEYYYDALKDCILNLFKQKGVEVLESDTGKMFPKMNDEFREVLQRIENETLDSKGELYVKPVEYLSYEDGLTQFSKFKDGVLSMAHPTVFYPMHSLKNPEKMVELYEALYSDFAKFAKDKAIMSEDLYQTYYKDANQEILKKIREISSKYNLLPTGGLDTHGLDIFSV